MPDFSLHSLVVIEDMEVLQYEMHKPIVAKHFADSDKIAPKHFADSDKNRLKHFADSDKMLIFVVI